MKKYFLLLCLPLISCDLTYDSETRLVLKTAITDQNGAPASNVNVDLSVNVEDYSEGISHGRTDANGNLTMIFPNPDAENARFTMTIANNNPIYLQKVYLDLPKSGFTGYTYAVAAQIDKLADVVKLNVTFEDVNNTSAISQFAIVGMRPVEFVYPEDETGNNYTSFNFYYVYKNQTVQIQYTVVDNASGVGTPHTIDVPVATTDLTYNITF
jgi:5-hydroxyisourate hydrolase-like protein (transthyretin family)